MPGVSPPRGTLVGLRFERSRAQVRRIRGKGRHFRNVLRAAERFAIYPERDSWWDLWHYHADWRGFGNLGWRYRREYARALGIVFSRIVAVSDQFATPFQVFLSLQSTDAGGDAVYLHTPNPNGTPFPYVPKAMAWGMELPHR